MKSYGFPSGSASKRLKTLLKLGVLLLGSVTAGAVGTSGCLDRPICPSEDEAADRAEPCRPRTTNVFVDRIQQRAVDKIDLLFMIDNSISMADKQEVLQAAVPDLVERLVNPICVNEATGEVQTAPTADANCADGFAREFTPIKNIHIGIVTSSIEDYAGLGYGVCGESEDDNDLAHMLGARPRALGLGLAPAPEQPPGFLDWNPVVNVGQDVNAFNMTFQQLVAFSGELGCGYESSLEAWYRFLVDPSPPAGVQQQPCSAQNPAPCARPVGPDQAILAQRAAFLRSDSLVAIIMLTDENDCSIQNRDQLSYIADPRFPVPIGSTACNANPNDRCCYNCALGVPEGCSPDPACAGAPAATPDPPNLRCFQQKRRFGASFLYPPQRYVNALSQTTLCIDRPDLDPTQCASPVPNPLFVGADASIRDTGLVFLAGIIGVPWQDIQTFVDADGNMITDPNVLRYKTAEDMRNDGTWNVILGDPDNPQGAIAPSDGLMVESIAPRGGTSFTGEALAAPGAGFFANSVNGHEWANPQGDDLQYSCIMPLAATRDCATLDPQLGCDCKAMDVQGDLNPLCQDQGGGYSTNQGFAKAYPPIRQLQVLRLFGDNAIVASICARNVDNPGAPDYGYRPAISAIVDRLKEALTGRCLPRELKPNADGSMPCSIVEVRRPGGLGCADLPGRTNPDAKVIDPVFKRLREAGLCGPDVNIPCTQGSFTICEIQEATQDATGDGVPDCWQDLTTQPEVGWCYVAPDDGRGDLSLVENCKATERRLLRFVDPNPGQTPARNATVLIACLGAEIEDETAPAAPAPTPTMPAPVPDSGAMP